MFFRNITLFDRRSAKLQANLRRELFVRVSLDHVHHVVAEFFVIVHHVHVVHAHLRLGKHLLQIRLTHTEAQHLAVLQALRKGIDALEPL